MGNDHTITDLAYMSLDFASASWGSRCCVTLCVNPVANASWHVIHLPVSQHVCCYVNITHPPRRQGISVDLIDHFEWCYLIREDCLRSHQSHNKIRTLHISTYMHFWTTEQFSRKFSLFFDTRGLSARTCYKQNLTRSLVALRWIRRIRIQGLVQYWISIRNSS